MSQLLNEHDKDDDFSMRVYILLQFMGQAVIGIGWGCS